MPAGVLETTAAITAAEPAVTASRRGGLRSLPEVRWAILATALFAAGLIVHLVAGPPAVAWALFLACFAAGGWEPGWPACGRCARGPSTWTC